MGCVTNFPAVLLFMLSLQMSLVYKMTCKRLSEHPNPGVAHLVVQQASWKTLSQLMLRYGTERENLGPQSLVNGSWHRGRNSMLKREQFTQRNVPGAVGRAQRASMCDPAGRCYLICSSFRPLLCLFSSWVWSTQDVL